jgi:hypothetical protein
MNLRSIIAISCGFALLGVVGVARAEPVAAAAARTPARRHAPLPGSDGVYARFDGNLMLAAAAGLELEGSDPRGTLRLSGHYLWTAGVYARYEDAFGSDIDRAVRVLSLGVDLRPLFLPRFALDAERGPALWDLTLDSVSLTAGAYFGQPRRGSIGDERGFEAGLGLGAPLLGSARGPWLQARAERRFADGGPNAWLWTVSLAWHEACWSTDTDAR